MREAIPVDADQKSAPSLRHRLLTFGAFVGAQVVALWVLWAPLVDKGWWTGFRGYFANDQLSYAAIASTVSSGVLAPVEPLTETGTSYYPSAWYQFIGLIGLVTGQPVYRLWTVLGLLAVGAMVAIVGAAAYRFSRLWIAPLFPSLSLTLGTLSIATQDWWYTALSNHAVIWGPFGTLFTLNAEAFGIVVNVCVLVALLTVSTGSPHARVWLIVSALSIGALANVQTYSFFTGSFLAVAFVALRGFASHPSRTRLVASIALLAFSLVSGGWVASIVGPLPLFVLVLLSALPLAWPLIRAHTTFSLLLLVAFVIAALPQVARTALGLASGDDFLSYRQASTEDLGVPPGGALIAALPLLLFASVTLIAFARARDSRTRSVLTSILIALGVGAVVLGSNDLWGFDQEPYRFWLQFTILTAFTLAITTAWSLREWQKMASPWKALTAVLLGLAVLTWAWSTSDVRAFRDFAAEQGVIPLEDSRSLAIQRAVPPDATLVLSSLCVDPQVLKLLTQAPVVYFNRGLAWPQEKDQIDQLLDPGRVAGSDPTTLANYAVSHVVTDSACEGDWSYTDARIQPLTIEPYEGGVITVWRVVAVRLE